MTDQSARHTPTKAHPLRTLAIALGLCSMALQPLPGLTMGVVVGTAVLSLGTPAAAATKAIPGVGIRIKKSPGGTTSRAAPPTTSRNGAFSVRVTDSGDYSVILDGNQIEGAANGLVARDPTFRAADAAVLVTFAPGLVVRATNGQAPILPNVFVVSNLAQEFLVTAPRGGITIAGILSMEDFTLAPGETAKGIKDPGVKSCGSCGMTGRMIPNPLGLTTATPLRTAPSAM